MTNILTIISPCLLAPIPLINVGLHFCDFELGHETKGDHYYTTLNLGKGVDKKLSFSERENDLHAKNMRKKSMTVTM